MTAYSSCAEARRSTAGFSLIEMAVALFVMALILGGLLVPLQSQVNIRNLDATRQILERAREALLGYAAAYGYLPCPASSTSNGQELLAVAGDHSSACHASVTGTNAYVGFLPAVTIGLTQVDGSGYALDAWGGIQNRIRYAVANATVNGVNYPLTRTSGMRNATMASIQSATTLLYVCSTGTGVTATGCAAPNDELSDNALAVIWSLGQNAPSGGAAPHESRNLDDNRVFVLAPYTIGAGNVFDDQITWIGPPDLFNRLITAGLLP